MTRPLRIEYAGALYHITSRGDRREDIYRDDDDREAWLATFAQVCARFNWRCHAWCLMDNHYHLVVETIEGNLAKGMRQLNGVFTQQFNRRHGLHGHLFQGRYKAILVERESYLLELTRYVVLNPLRARMVTDLGQWHWSSYRTMIGEAAKPRWLETDWLLSQFGRSKKSAMSHYKRFVLEGAGLAPVWDDLKQQIFLGSDIFIEQLQEIHALEKSQQDLTEVPQLQRRSHSKTLDWYQDHYDNRDRAMAQAYLSGEFTMKAISTEFKVHYATVSRAVRKLENP